MVPSSVAPSTICTLPRNGGATTSGGGLGTATAGTTAAEPGPGTFVFEAVADAGRRVGAGWSAGGVRGCPSGVSATVAAAPRQVDADGVARRGGARRADAHHGAVIAGGVGLPASDAVGDLLCASGEGQGKQEDGDGDQNADG